MPVYLPPMNRRKFITSTSIATAGLMFGLKGNLFGFDNRSEVDPDYFILVSDTHIDENRSTEVGAGLADRFSIVIERVLNDTSRKPAGMIVTGDVARTRGLPGDYLAFMDIVQPLRDIGIPIYLCMGNHDHRGNCWEAVPAKKPGEIFVENKHILIVESPHAYHFILDTLYIVNGSPGLLQQEQLDWLATALPGYIDKPVIMYGHHHPSESSSGLSSLEDVDELWDIVRPLRQVKAYIYGHTHAWSINNFHGLHGINLPATAGAAGSNTTGFAHAEFKSDRVFLRLNTLDESHVWNGQSGSLIYRSDEVTSMDNSEFNPGTIHLHQNYPNPFNPMTTIRYEISATAHVNLSVYDIQGRHVVDLVDETKSVGQHEVIFNAGNLKLSSGSYIYRLITNNSVLSQTMSLIK